MTDILAMVLQQNKKRLLRTFLTMLQVMLGIAAIAIIFTIIFSLQDGLDQLSVDSVYELRVQENRVIDGQNREITHNLLTQQDIDQFKNNIKTISLITTAESYFSPLLKIDDEYIKVNRIGLVSPDYKEITDLVVEEGSFFTEKDYVEGNQVCLIEKTAANNIYGDKNPLGEKFEMYRSWRNSPDNLPEPREFTIIGVYEANNAQGYSRLSNNQLLAPVSVNKPINMVEKSEVVKKDGNTVMVKSIPGSSSQKFYSVFLKIEEGQYNTTKSALEAMIQDKYGQEYMVNLNESFSSLEHMKTSIRYISLVMLGFGFLILIIGSIGILSTMMVNILERTRQIGIEKALGASRRYIFFKFSIESIMISLGGAILGLVLAYFTSGYITEFFTNMPVSFPKGLHLNAIYLSLIVAIVVGWLFGMYPAQQAAKLDVTEALREK